MSVSALELLSLARDARQRLETLRLPEPAVRICVAGLRHMEQVLEKPPRVAIMGEVNSGKTSVADLLLGSGVLPASVIANTHVPVLIRYSGMMTLDAVTQQGPYRLTEETLDELPSGLQLKRIEIGLPNECLQAFELLDTPGDYVPGGGMPDAQIFLWCTVATRAWTESERAHWSALPPRCRHRARLVATHKDALASPGDVDKVERRLRMSTAGLFRDVLFVAAGGSRPSSSARAPKPDPSVAMLREQVAKSVAEVSARRARKAERIIRHLARLTLHRLTPTLLSFEADAILKTWERDSAKLLASVDGPAAAQQVIRALLLRFAQAMNEARSGRGTPGNSSPLRDKSARRANGARRAAAAHRYVALIVADLTALLRINLAQQTLQDTPLRADYAAVRAILVPLADLDAIFDDLGQKLTSTEGPGRSETSGDPQRPPPLPPSLSRTLGAG